MTIRAILSSTALVTTLAAATFVGAQDQEAVPVSSEQFGYSGKAVAETNFQLAIFGGGDENGGLAGGAPSLTIPLGDKGGLQIDGIAGFVADEVGFAGGAAQLFYRDPQTFMIGIVGAGYYVDSYSQYAVSGIAEYYLDNVTLEGTVGYLTGKVLDGEVYGRVGLSIYPNPNLRIGGGVTYSEETDFGGDIQVEALLTDVPGMALFATGAFDDAGATGYGGVKFYFNSATNLLSDDRTKQAAEPTLIGLHRNMVRPNFFLSDPNGFGIRQISRAAGAIKGGDPFGEIDDPDGPDEPPACVDTDPNTAGCQPTPANPGLIDVVNDLLGNLGNDSAIAPLTDLLNGLTNPITGQLGALTGPLNDLTLIDGGPLGPLTELVNGLTSSNDGALDPLVEALNTVLSGFQNGADPAAIADALAGLPGADQLAGLLGGGLPIPGLGGGSNPLAGVPVLGDLVGALTDAASGGLPIPGAGGGANPLEGVPVLGDLVGTLTDAASGGLPIPGAGGGANPLAGIPVLGDLLAGLPIPGATGGGAGGTIDTVQDVVGDLLAGTPLEAVAGGVDTLVDPSTGALAALTGPLNDATDVISGPLGPLTTVVDTLAGDHVGALDPVLDAVNDLLSGQVPSIPGLPGAGGDNPLAGVPVLGDLAGTLTSLASGGLPLPGVGGGGSPLDGIPVLGDLAGALPIPG